MITKEELLNQRQPVNNKNQRIIVARTGPNRAERRRQAKLRRTRRKQ